MSNNCKIGLALGAGSARGLAHIGVLETLKDYNISFDMVSGSSAGALIGCLYCCGIDFKYVKALFKNLQQKDYIDITVPRKGLIKGDRIQEIIKLITQNKNFEDLNIPLIVTATDLKNKKLIEIETGKLHEAVRASISIPGIFAPVEKVDMILVDGAVIERVPANTLKKRGMDLVIGVDVGSNIMTCNCRSIFHVLYEAYDLMQLEYFNYKKNEADIMIKVDLDDMDPTRFDLVDMCVERGKAATEEKIPAIKKKIDELNYIMQEHKCV